MFAKNAQGHLLVIGMVVLGALLSGSPAIAGTPFTTEYIDTSNHVLGLYHDLDFGPEGTPYVAYYDEDSLDLLLGWFNGLNWEYEVVDTEGDVGRYCSLKIGADGTPHIAYVANTDTVRYAYRSGATWMFETVGVAASSAFLTSLALHPDGKPHIVYSDSNIDIWYAIRTVPGFWSRQARAVNVTSLDLAISTDGIGHVVYKPFPQDRLIYRTVTNSVWDTNSFGEAIGSDTGSGASVAVDRSGRPWAAYRQIAAPDTLKVMMPVDNGLFSFVALTTASFAEGKTSIAVRDDGEVFIAYRSTTGRLSLARYSGQEWSFEVVSQELTHHNSSVSMDLDEQGNPHAVYGVDHFGNEDDLKFAYSSVRLYEPFGGERWASGAPQPIRWGGVGPVDLELSTDGGSTWSSLLTGVFSNDLSVTVPSVATEQARLRVIRADPPSSAESAGDFSIAPGLVSPWWTESITNITAGSPSLALTAAGELRVSYVDFVGQELWYAEKVNGMWSAEVVSDSASTLNEGGSSIALDPAGEPRILYYNESLGQIEYTARENGIWATETVSTASGQRGSFGIDAAGMPHVAINNGGQLLYQWDAGGSWPANLVAGSVSSNPSPVLALDNSGRPHIVYHDFASGELTLASFTGLGNPWDMETVFDGQVDGVDLAFDAGNVPHVAYLEDATTTLMYAVKRNGAWHRENVDPEKDPADDVSIEIDTRGRPHIVYTGLVLLETAQYHATRTGNAWSREEIPFSESSFSVIPSFALDAHDNGHALSLGISDGIWHISSAVEMNGPAPDEVWPVGSSRTIRWSGTGLVDLSLSLDGGQTFETLDSGVSGGSYPLIVPHSPSKFARLRVDRAVPRSQATTTQLFVIETSISLLSLSGSMKDGMVELLWATDPGPADLAGYRLERRDGGDWSTIVALTRETSYLDPSGKPGSDYRLHGVNGLGEELLLGEIAVAPRAPLAAWPLPYRSGQLNISFATAGGRGEGAAPTEITLFDAAGRRVRRVLSGDYETGYQQTTWDGTDDAGRRVVPGVYFLKSASAGEQTVVKVTVLR